MRTKCIAIILAISMIALTGCKPKTLEGVSKVAEYGYSNAYDLKSGKLYVWDNKDEEDIRNDLKKDREGENVFFLCPMGDINFKGDELEDISHYPRSIWFDSGSDSEIPTVTKDTALIYVSESKVPKEIVFERFADYGYTIGISNLSPDGGGHYYIVYAETKEDDYKYYVDLKSDAKDVTEFKDIDRLFLDKVGGISVDERTVSSGGTVMGLLKDKSYICEFYTGTFYQDFKLTANIHAFGSLERFVLYDYEFLHANCIRINIPEWLKSGYYFVEGAGLFRYVSEEDERRFNGSSYDGGIDWNEPIKKYDEYGVCIFDPSLGIGIEEEDDPLNEEMIEEGSDIDEPIPDDSLGSAGS